MDRQTILIEQHQVEEDYLWREQSLQMEADVQLDIFYEVSPEQMRQRLHKNTAVIIGRAKELEFKGSGILISQNLVLTCAHILFYTEKSMSRQQTKTIFKPSQLQVYPGHFGSLFNGQEVECVYVPPEYISNQKQQHYDYALIKLKRKVKSFDFIRLNYDLKIQRDQEIGIFGYPKSSYTYNKTRQIIVRQRGLTKKNAICQLEPQKGKILHRISTEKGQSGSPIVLINDKDLSIVGIHIGTIQSRKMNLGRLITKKLVEILISETKKMNAQMFITEDKTSANFVPNKQKEQNEQNYIRQAIEIYLKILIQNDKNYIIHEKMSIRSEKTVIRKKLSYYRNIIKLNKDDPISP